MSISTHEGVVFAKPKIKKSVAFILILMLLEGVFTFFLYLALAGRIFESNTAESAAGVPKLLSYQGRLTDSSGNALGGTGTVYCFRYSIYDAVSGGNQVWPTSTPANSTTTVTDGVFNDNIGRTDTLTYDFLSTSTVFLNIGVATSTCATFETLAPRQQITASGFALTSKEIYGDALRTSTSTKAQVGTGAGQATSTMTLLSLDVANVAEKLDGSCSNNGTIWYNSALTRALVCENSQIKVLSNSSTTIAGIGTNASTPITAGTVVFSNSNGVTFGINASTITASVAAGGDGGGATIKHFSYPGDFVQSWGIGIASLSLQRIWVPAQLSATQARFMAHMSGASGSTGGISMSLAVYTLSQSTASLASSTSLFYSWSSGTATSVSSIYGGNSGTRWRTMNIGTFNLTPGDYLIGAWFRTTNAGTWTFFGKSSLSLVSEVNVNASQQFQQGYSNASFTTAMPSSINITNTQYERRGATANRQPGIVFLGTQ